VAGANVSNARFFLEIQCGRLFIALYPSPAGKSGSVGGDGRVVSTTASLVFQTRAEAEASSVQTIFFEPLGHSPHNNNPVHPLAKGLGIGPVTDLEFYSTREGRARKRFALSVCPSPPRLCGVGGPWWFRQEGACGTDHRNLVAPSTAVNSAASPSLGAPRPCSTPACNRIRGILTTPLADRLAPKRSSIAPA